MLCRQFARLGETKESVSNDDGDGNKNGKKAMGLDSHNNNFARRSRYLYISLPSLHDYNVQLPIFTFYWGPRHKKEMSDPLFVHVFMTKPEIITFTFCTNIFRLKGRKALQEFSEHFASQTAINQPHRKYWLGNFFLPVMRFKFYFETRASVF